MLRVTIIINLASFSLGSLDPRPPLREEIARRPSRLSPHVLSPARAAEQIGRGPPQLRGPLRERAACRKEDSSMELMRLRRVTSTARTYRIAHEAASHLSETMQFETERSWKHRQALPHSLSCTQRSDILSWALLLLVKCSGLGSLGLLFFWAAAASVALMGNSPAGNQHRRVFKRAMMMALRITHRKCMFSFEETFPRLSTNSPFHDYSFEHHSKANNARTIRENICN